MTFDGIREAVQKWPAELFQEWTERSAIKEFDGKLSRVEAEMQAYWELRPYVDLPIKRVAKPTPIHDGSFFTRLRTELKEK